MGRCRDFFLLCLLFCNFSVENVAALLFQTFLSSNSKKALTPKIVTLTLSCHLIEFKVFLQQIIDEDACAIFIETMKTFQFSVPETPLYSFLLPCCFCRRSSIQFALHNAVVKIFLVLSSSSSSLFSPPILFTSFLLSLASTLQCVLESYFTKARDQPLDSLHFQKLPHRQFNTKMTLRIKFYLIM